MPRLAVCLFGPLQVTLDGEPVTGFDSDKVRALLSYLAVETDAPQRREKLAGLLWPDQTERSARANLRHVLANLRKVIGDRAADPPFLHITHQTIQFNHSSNAWVDVSAFTSLLQTSQSTNRHAIHQLEEAAELVRGGFMEGFSLAGCSAFEEWVLSEGERLQRQALEVLGRLSDWYEKQGNVERALEYSWRQVELEPWREKVQRQVMRLLALGGQRGAALAQYETCRRTLADELGVEPEPETTKLYEQIRDGELEVPTVAPAQVRAPEPLPRLPRFLEQEINAVEPPVFVAMERELARLNAHLDETLAGHGRVVFVTGGPGRGKTALLAEFGRRATEAHANLLVASGNCNAYSGVGDPYLPFREVMVVLTGDVEARWLAGTVTTTQARRVWDALPVAIQSLLRYGPSVTGPLVGEQALLSRAALWCATTAGGPHSPDWLDRLRRRVEHRRADPEGTDQSHLFQQVTSLLRNFAETHPLLLVLDDLQWADTASISLLFHLGRRLEGARILIAGAYRPVEVSLDQGGERHPLEKVLSEFKRTYGDVWLDLADVDELERRRFVDSLLETEPNRLGEAFRRVLTEHTGGHPLFTAELLRAMQARGDLFRDEAGRWTHGPVLDWQTLPARVEGVIEERVGRLEPELRQILSVASVEGEAFTVQVVAQVRGMEEGQLLHRLAQDLARQHRLVMEQAEVRIGPRRLSRFKFGHVLVQNYLYQQLGQGQRRLLHGQVAAALESCYGEQVDVFAVQLAHHHDRAGNDGRALFYLTRAAENAHRVYANDEAYRHYTRAIEAAERVSADAETVIRLYVGRGLVCQGLGEFEGVLADYEAALQLADGTDDPAVERLEWRALLGLGRLWASRDYSRAHDHFQRALELAEGMGDPTLVAGSLNWMGNWYLNAEKPREALAHHVQALEIFERVEDQRGLATTLDLLGIASLLGGDITAAVKYYNRAIPLFREIDDQPNLASSLTGRAHASCSTFTLLTLVPSVIPVSPRRDLREALRIAEEIGSPDIEAWVLWSEGLLKIVQGRYGQALEAARGGLDIATQIGHREDMAASQCVLGVLCLELLAPEKARRHLEAALSLAEGLRSPAMIHWAIGALTADCCQLDDLKRAQACLETVPSAEMPMDTMYGRYCWARRAELALCQGEPALALDIVERLIASALNMVPGRVITFLWKLKGEALSAMGRKEEAQALLQATVENAQATGERFLLWRLHASLGRLYLSMDQQSEAGEEFATAHELIQELADTLPDGELRNSFLQRAHDSLSPSP